MIAGYTTGPGPPLGPLRLAGSRPCTTRQRASSAGSATSAPASATGRSTACSGSSSRSSETRAAVPRGAEDATCPQGRRRLGRAEARRRGRVRRVDARRPPARAVVPGAARGQAGGGGRARGPRGGAAPIPTELRQGGRVLRLSNLDKPFWPEEGITKGDLLAYYRDVASVLVPHLQRPAVHDEALPRRLEGPALLPEGRAEAHARLDQRPRGSRSRRATGRRSGGGSTSRS